VGAVALIVCHKHPSGDLKPSGEDCGISKRLIEAGNELGIQLLDHVVCGSNSFHSTREQNSELFGGN
jgi:DNA repair protein RadC